MISSWLTASKILLNLTEYRETLYIVFGILCLAAWLVFNIYALREYLCPFWFGDNKKYKALKKEFLEKARLSSAIVGINTEERINYSMKDLQSFIV